MGTNSDRLNMWLPDDGVGGTDDDYNVTLDLSDNLAKLDSAVGIFHCTAATHPTVNNFIGRLIKETDTGTILMYNGSTWDVLYDTKWQTYAGTVISTPGGNVTIGNSVITSLYKRKFNDVTVKYRFELGNSGFSGGTGDWSFPLPFPCVTTGSTDGGGWIYVHGNSFWTAQPIIRPGNTALLYVNSAINGANAWAFRNALHPAGGVGTGAPAILGAFTFDSAAPDSELYFDITYQYV